jgi:type IV pilus assembly protein PilW
MTQKRLHGSRRQTGLTLIELMVAVAVSLILILAASMLYINTRAIQKATDERSQVFETGRLALQILGGDLGKASFYPAAYSEDPRLTDPPIKPPIRNNYEDGVFAAFDGAVPSALSSGLFGCDGTQVSDVLTGCMAAEAVGTVNAGASDGLLVAYFASDAFSLDAGDRADCTRSDAVNADYNSARAGAAQQAALGGLPSKPLLVVNRYFLKPTTYQTESGQTVSTFSLSCRGNGNNDGKSAIQLVTGIERFGVRYGVVAPGSNRAPTHFLSATEVAALPAAATIDDHLYPTGWDRVVAVEVCVLARSFSKTGLASAGVSLTGCDGAAYTPPSGVQVRKFTQVFALKNRQPRLPGL